MRAHRAVVALVSILLFVLGLIPSWIIATVLVRPLEEMTRISSNIAKGDLSQDELKVATGDEVGQMAAAFNRMLRYLRELSASADRVAKGDLTVHIDMEGQVADAFNRMVDEQRTVVKQLAHTSVQLASAASQIHTAARQQQATATQQSAGVEEMAGTMQTFSIALRTSPTPPATCSVTPNRPKMRLTPTPADSAHLPHIPVESPNCSTSSATLQTAAIFSR